MRSASPKRRAGSPASASDQKMQSVNRERPYWKVPTNSFGCLPKLRAQKLLLHILSLMSQSSDHRLESRDGQNQRGTLESVDQCVIGPAASQQCVWNFESSYNAKENFKVPGSYGWFSVVSDLRSEDLSSRKENVGTRRPDRALTCLRNICRQGNEEFASALEGLLSVL
jgi:hypothetical protein